MLVVLYRVRYLAWQTSRSEVCGTFPENSSTLREDEYKEEKQNHHRRLQEGRCAEAARGGFVSKQETSTFPENLICGGSTVGDLL